MSDKIYMSEKAYIVVRDLTKLRDVARMLYDFSPTMENLVDLDEYHVVQKLTEKWMRQLERSFECEGE